MFFGHSFTFLCPFMGCLHVLQLRVAFPEVESLLFCALSTSATTSVTGKHIDILFPCLFKGSPIWSVHIRGGVKRLRVPIVFYDMSRYLCVQGGEGQFFVKLYVHTKCMTPS